jgi:phosphohistidine phosphatase
MPTLCLFRHAKAAHPSSGQLDFDRALTDRGREDAARMGGALTPLAPDLALVSPAARTRETWDIAGSTLPGTARSLDPDLYLCSAETLVAIARALPDATETAILVGHNPGLHELALWLAASSSGQPALALRQKFPTASLAVFAIDAGWVRLSPSRARLTSFVTPADLL